MSELDFQVEWESPQGARGPELRATWGRLRIAIGDQVVTQIEDRVAASVRQVQDIAEEFGTSDWVVRHQIENHGLARLFEWKI